MDVQSFLEQLNLTQYVHKFQTMGVMSLNQLKDLEADEFEEKCRKMGVLKGHIIKLKKKLQQQQRTQDQIEANLQNLPQNNEDTQNLSQLNVSTEETLIPQKRNRNQDQAQAQEVQKSNEISTEQMQTIKSTSRFLKEKIVKIKSVKRQIKKIENLVKDVDVQEMLRVLDTIKALKILFRNKRISKAKNRDKKVDNQELNSSQNPEKSQNLENEDVIIPQNIQEQQNTPINQEPINQEPVNQESINQNPINHNQKDQCELQDKDKRQDPLIEKQTDQSPVEDKSDQEKRVNKHQKMTDQGNCNKISQEALNAMNQRILAESSHMKALFNGKQQKTSRNQSNVVYSEGLSFIQIRFQDLSEESKKSFKESNEDFVYKCELCSLLLNHIQMQSHAKQCKINEVQQRRIIRVPQKEYKKRDREIQEDPNQKENENQLLLKKSQSAKVFPSSISLKTVQSQIGGQVRFQYESKEKQRLNPEVQNQVNQSLQNQQKQYNEKHNNQADMIFQSINRSNQKDYAKDKNATINQEA